MNSLRDRVIEDPENCKFFTELGPELKNIEMSFDFQDVTKRSIVVVIPESYPNLHKMVTPTQEIEANAFAKWVQPMHPTNLPVGVLYKIYVFNQPLVKLKQTLKFYFKA